MTPLDYERLQSNVDYSSPLPSFFELFTSSTLNQSTSSFLNRHISAGLSTLDNKLHNFFPSLHRLPSLQPTSNEFQLLLLLFLEHRSLKHHSATVLERFYSMTRSHSKKTPNGNLLTPLTPTDKNLSLFFHIFLPYLKSKLDKLYATLKATDSQTANTNISINNNNKTRKTFLFLYPFLHLTHDGAFIAYQFAYLFGFTLHFTPTLALTNQVVRRVTAADTPASSSSSSSSSSAASAAAAATPPPPANANTKRNNKRYRAAKIACAATISAYFLYGWMSNLRRSYGRKMLEQRNLLENGTLSGVVPPPPSVQVSAEATFTLPSNPALCPICRRKKVNAVVSVVSGYAFCYKCLILHVRENGRCPLSLLEMSEKQVVQIFI